MSNSADKQTALKTQPPWQQESVYISIAVFLTSHK